ncbi:flagellin [Castellaniella sp. MT123]|uniref:flagellin N-terminal helical domain-containing protein n=1 Tax=Castellaniella sp. MT123 TaxID=3140381 RepID=UPI0031F39436
MLTVRSNLPGLTAQHHLENSGSALQAAIQRLSSGLRINSAKDDAAGQAIANRMTSQIQGLTQASRNVNDGISLSQTAQGALGEINARLQRIRELSVQGLSGQYAGDAGDAIQAEINMNLKEIERLNQSASFNGISLLDGTAGQRALQVGADDGDQLALDMRPPGFSVRELGLLDLTVQGLPGRITPVSTLAGSSYRIDLDDAARTSVSYVPPTNNPNVVRMSQPSSRQVVQLDGNGGRLQEVRINASYDTDTRKSAVTLGVDSAVVAATVQESISSWQYLDQGGGALSLSGAAVVTAGGKYWIQHQVSGTTYYREAELTIHGDQHQITAQAKTGVSIDKASLPGPVSQPLQAAPAVSLATAAYTMSLDGTDQVGNPDMNLVHLGGYYFVEEKLLSGQYAYYKADVTITTGGAQDKVTVVSDRSRTISVSDEQYVSGTTTAYLKPSNNNVQVNYVDVDGWVIADVMRDDGKGGYEFRLDGSSGGYPAYKSAKVVANQQGQYMLQTVNGMGEVYLYYPMYKTRLDGTTYYPFTVSSNAAADKTVITLYEADIAQRLRTPPDPLATIDRAIERVDQKRGEWGALDNRMESIVQQNAGTGADLTAARSRIQDADYAVEVSNMTRAQILQQAGVAALTQANQLPQAALRLISG